MGKGNVKSGPQPGEGSGSGEVRGIGPTFDGPWEAYEGGNFVKVGIKDKYRAYVQAEAYLGGPFEIEALLKEADFLARVALAKARGDA